MVKIDFKFEQAIKEYLKKNTLLPVSNIEWVNDEIRQKQGIDLIADYIGGRYMFDIKSIASPLPTFSQEIGNLTSLNVGWIMNEDLKTDFYIYTWHEVKGAKTYTEAKELVIEDINNILDTDICIVRKDILKSYIEEEIGFSLNKETAKAIMRCVKQFPIDGGIEYFIFHPNYKIQRVSKDKKGNGVYMTRSNSLNEKPLNFIIKKTILKELEEQSIEACKK